ncbi:hypothetical protein EELLY_v1c01350 [Entomoplasma ellychniae]|uniref:Uncharacterized protein n=1 Tax=Entomoplasma ellychniae TaxID=2114 RepID=A0A8E2QXL3_9MOLU|nr:lipoprotein [Entomoplasma ellychniae]PPE04460.1 hypothetical protein EELLY_v1c01350 [Entomoplasma ellychniae]
MKKLLTLLAAVGLTATASAGVVACDTKIKVESIKTAIGSDIKDLADLAAVNAALAAKLQGTTNATLKGVKSLSAALKSGSKTDVLVTPVANDGYKLSGQTFEIAGAIKAEAAVSTKPVIAAIDAVSMKVGEEVKEVAVSLTNPIEGENISAVSGTPAAATVAVDGSKIKITPVAVGESTITVSYKDAQAVTFKVTVAAAEGTDTGTAKTGV